MDRGIGFDPVIITAGVIGLSTLIGAYEIWRRWLSHKPFNTLVDSMSGLEVLQSVLCNDNVGGGSSESDLSADPNGESEDALSAHSEA